MASILCSRSLSPNIAACKSFIAGGRSDQASLSLPIKVAKASRRFYCTASAQQVELTQGIPNSSATLHYQDDTLDICRVVNGMWQTSGGWGKIDAQSAVDAMLRYVDAGFFTFDMADHWKIKTLALTNFDTERLQIILENEIPIVSNQVQNSVVDTRPQRKMAELCQLTGVKLITYGTVMGGLLSEKFLDTNISIPFVGSSLNTPSLNKYKKMVDTWGGWSLYQELLRTLKRISLKHGVSIPTVAVRYVLNQPAVAASMIGVRLGLSEHIKDSKAIFSLQLDEEDEANINQVSAKGRDLLKIIGDCGDEYRRA